jgi:uncharacterized membrane protein required for colicin V production
MSVVSGLTVGLAEPPFVVLVNVVFLVVVGSVVVNFAVVELGVGFFSGTVGFFVGNITGLIGLLVGWSSSSTLLSLSCID